MCDGIGTGWDGIPGMGMGMGDGTRTGWDKKQQPSNQKQEPGLSGSQDRMGWDGTKAYAAHSNGAMYHHYHQSTTATLRSRLGRP